MCDMSEHKPVPRLDAPVTVDARDTAGVEVPVSLYAAERKSGTGLRCRHGGRANPLPRVWCISCGHRLGMPMPECVLGCPNWSFSLVRFLAFT